MLRAALAVTMVAAIAGVAVPWYRDGIGIGMGMGTEETEASLEPLRRAIRSADIRKVKNLLQEDDVLRRALRRRGSGHTPLHDVLAARFFAMSSGRFTRRIDAAYKDILRALLQHVSAREGCPVIDAVHYMFLDSFESLLKSMSVEDMRTCFTEQDSLGNTILHTVMQSKAPGIARVLLRRGGRPTQATIEALRLQAGSLQEGQSEKRFTFSELNSAISSHFAAKILGVGQQAFRDMEEFSSWLLTKNKKGQTCLLCACAGGRVDDVQLLLPHSTSMSIHVDSSNRTCAMIAASRGFEELLLALHHRGKLQLPQRDSFGRNLQDIVCMHPCIMEKGEIRKVLGKCGQQDGRERQRTGISIFHPGEPVVLLPDEPVLLKKAALGWKAEKWARDDFFRGPHGQIQVSVGDIPYAQTYGEPAARMSLRSFAEGAHSSKKIVFDAGSVLHYAAGPQQSKMIDDVEPDMSHLFRSLGLDEEPQGFYQFSYGYSLSGAAPHYHGAAANVLVSGKKSWRLTPPGNSRCSEFSKRHAHTVFQNGKDSCEPCLRVEQEAGDVLFVPEFWSHATLNHGKTIAIAFEYR
eukprot:g1701.t1